MAMLHSHSYIRSYMDVACSMDLDNNIRSYICVTRPAKIDHVNTKKLPIFSVSALS